MHKALALFVVHLMLGAMPFAELLQPLHAEDAIHGIGDFLRKAPRFIAPIEHIASAFALAGENRHVSIAPAVDCLLAVADHKDAARAVLALQRFVDKVSERGPLFAAGILKFIKRPVANARIEPIFKRQSRIGIKPHYQARDIAKGKLPARADLPLVLALVGIKQDARRFSRIRAHENLVDIHHAQELFHIVFFGDGLGDARQRA